MKINLTQAFQTVKDVFIKPQAGQRYAFEASDRASGDVSRGLDPAAVDRIMLAANLGDITKQTSLSYELEEKNHDISHAISTRKNAVAGCEWDIKCADQSTTGKHAIFTLKKELESVNFYDALTALSSAIVPGFSVVEILWNPGGGIAGFKPLDGRAITFINSADPLIRLSGETEPLAFPPHKVIFQRMTRGFDTARGGLIRPLAWLHCFQNLNLKGLLSFIERYGQPFIVAKADESAITQEKDALIRLIRAFGTSGGGLFSKAVEFELLQSANNSGDCYFKLLEYVEKAITKVILGQTATAGDGGGWSNDSAQSQVRQDILDADCRAIEAVVTRQLFAPWAAFNAPALSAPLTFKIKSEPPEDTVKKYDAIKKETETIEIAVRSGVLTASPDIEAIIREKMGYPVMSADVISAWNQNGNTRKMTAEQPPGIAFAEDMQNGTLSENQLQKIAENWLKKPSEKLIAIANNPDDDAFDAELKKMSDDPEEFWSLFNTSAVSDPLEKNALQAVKGGEND